MLDPTIDLNDIHVWRDNPDIILDMARRWSYKWGHFYSDKEDLQMAIVESIIKALKKFDSKYNNSLYPYIWISAKRSVFDYGRKHGDLFKYYGEKGVSRGKTIYTKFYEYAEVAETDSAEGNDSGVKAFARFKNSTVDNHENFSLIQFLKKEPLQVREVIFYFYFLELNAVEIAEILGIKDTRIWHIIGKFKDRYYEENFPHEKYKFSSLSPEDLQTGKLENFYELVQKQSRVTQEIS